MALGISFPSMPSAPAAPARVAPAPVLSGGGSTPTPTPTPGPTPTPTPGALTAFDGMWADKIASVGWYSAATGRNALYDGPSAQTLMALEEYDPTAPVGSRAARLYAVAADGKRTGPYKLFDSQLSNDDHGVPNIALGPNRRLYAAGGSHGNGTIMQFSMSNANDFTAHTTITGPTYAADAAQYGYPHIVFRTSTAGNVIRRKERNDGNNMTLVDTPFTVNADGTLAWGVERELVNFGDGRAYAVDPIMLPNGKMRLMYTYSNYPDTYHQDSFVSDYDPVAGTLTSLTNGQTFPCPTSANVNRANFRVTRQAETGTYGGGSPHVLDAAGNYHFAYMESADGNSTAAAPMPIFYSMIPAGSQVQTAPIQIAVSIQRYSTFELREAKDGTIEMDFITQSPFFTQRVGNVSRVKRNAAGVWSAPKVIRECGPYAGFDRPQTVVNGNSGPIQSIFCECSYADNGNTGGSNNPTVGTLRAYAMSGDQAATISIPTDPALTTALGRLTTQPSKLSVQIANQAISAYRNLGLLTTRDAMWLQAGRVPEDADFARLDLIGTRDLTMNSGMSFAQVPGKSGYAWLGDGVTGVQATGFIPSTMGVNMTLNNAGAIVDVLTESQAAGAAISRMFASTGQNTVVLNPRNTAGNAQMRMVDATNANVANPSTVGTYIMRRTSAASRGLFKGGSSLTNDSTGATALPITQMLFGGGGTGDGNPSRAGQLALGSFGSSVGAAVMGVHTQVHYRFRQEMGLPLS